MELKDYIADPERRRLLADAAGTDPDYLWQIATGYVRKNTKKPTRASTDLALKIERETTRLGPRTVRKESLRPDVWPASSVKRVRQA
jgi:hypothetical protein